MWTNRTPWRMDPNGSGNCYHLDGWGKITLTTIDRSDPTIAMWNCPECKLSNPTWSPSCEAKACKGMNPDTVRALCMKAYLLQRRDAIKHAREVPWFVKHSLDTYLFAKSAGKTAHDLSGRPGFAQWEPAPSVLAEVRKRSEVILVKTPPNKLPFIGLKAVLVKTPAEIHLYASRRFW